MTSEIFAIGANFETGPRYVASAWNINKGGLYLTGQGRFYRKHETFTGPNNIESGRTIWDSQTSASLYWGLMHHVQLGVTPIISQKNHKTSNGLDSPGDLLLNVKLGSIGRVAGAFSMAFQFDLRLPVGAHHNIPLNPYSANAVGYGGMGLFSFGRPQGSGTRFSWDVNVGYFNHNDVGLKLSENNSDSTGITTATQEILFGTVARLTRNKFSLFAEVHGRYFMQQPPETAYTRENFIYFSPGVSFQFNPYIQFVVGTDLLLAGLDDQTIYEKDGVDVQEKLWRTVPNLPDWRVNIGLVFRLKEGSPRQTKAKNEKSVQVDNVDSDESKKAQDEKELRKQQEQDIEELERRLKAGEKEPIVESEEERLQRIEAERRRMLEVLQELRTAMEEREKAEMKQREEELRKAEERRRQEELKRQKELEAKALAEQEAREAAQDSLATQDTMVPIEELQESTGDTLLPDSSAAELPVHEQPAEEDTAAVSDSELVSPPDSSAAVPEFVPDQIETSDPDSSQASDVGSEMDATEDSPMTEEAELEQQTIPPEDNTVPADTTGTDDKNPAE